MFIIHRPVQSPSSPPAVPHSFSCALHCSSAVLSVNGFTTEAEALIPLLVHEYDLGGRQPGFSEKRGSQECVSLNCI